MKTKKSLQLLAAIKTLLLETKNIQPKQKGVIGFSGGQDSTSLLTILFILTNQWKFQINTLYCNHLWQKTNFYAYWHISKTSYSINKSYFYSPSIKFLKNEETSRYWRLKQYTRILQFINSSTFFTGHTLTDQVETFFFTLVRGSSLHGSYSLKPKKIIQNYFRIEEKEINFFLSEIEFEIFLEQKQLKQIFLLKTKKSKQCKKVFLLIPQKSYSIFIVRPLINRTRFDLNKLCKTWKLPLFPDISNEEKNYSRNFFRKQILPSLRFFFNPKLELTISKGNNLFIEEEKFFENLIFKLVPNLLYENKNFFVLNTNLLDTLHLAVQRKFCLYFFKEKLQIKYNFSLIEYFLDFCNKINHILKKEKKIRFASLFFPQLGSIYIIEQKFVIFK